MNTASHPSFTGTASRSIHRRRLLAGTAAALAAPWLHAQAPARAPHTLISIDSTGRPLALDALAGRVVLVSFFTASCATCGNELRLMRDFLAANRARGFALVGVNLDENAADFQRYAELLAVSVPEAQRFPVAWRNAPGHRDSFGPIARHPTHVVLNRQLREVRRREGGMQAGDWDDLWLSLS